MSVDKKEDKLFEVKRSRLLILKPVKNKRRIARRSRLRAKEERYENVSIDFKTVCNSGKEAASRIGLGVRFRR